MDPPAKPVPTLIPQMLGSAVTPVEEDHDEKFGVPTLEELGFDCDHLKPPVWVGGESEALSRCFFRDCLFGPPPIFMNLGHIVL